MTKPNGLETEIKRLSALYKTPVGVATKRLDHDSSVSVNGGERFPMASTFKIAVAGAVLEQSERGRLTLDQMIPIEPEMIVPSDVIANRFIHDGVSLSVKNLLEVMITESDNTATDVLMGAIGGPEVVTRWLRSIGIVDQRVDRDTAGMIRDFYRLPAAGRLKAVLEDALKASPELQRATSLPNPEYEDDPRDSTTPDAMAVLLSKIFTGHALGAAGTECLTDIMQRCRTGPARIKGMLPDGTVVAHKTGTIGGAINDVGVISLPDGLGKVVLAAFVKKSALPVPHRERLIAQIARAAYDYFLFEG